MYGFVPHINGHKFVYTLYPNKMLLLSLCIWSVCCDSLINDITFYPGSGLINRIEGLIIRSWIRLKKLL